jgi:copper chaperone
MSSTENAPSAESVATQTFRATGLTCGHCARAVSEELIAVPGVEAVEVEVVSGGESVVRVAASREIAGDEVTAALSEAGDYTLVSG